MSIKPAIRVLRFWYRVSHKPEVIALPHPARWWFYGVVMAWTGYNNCVIEFTRRRHGAQYRLSHPAVFQKARRAVIKAKLVRVTRDGGRNLPTLYALTMVENQAPLPRRLVGTRRVPTKEKIVGTRRVPVGEKTGTRGVPNRYTSRTKENDLHIMIARASDLETEKTSNTIASVTNIESPISPNQNHARKPH